MSEHEHDRSHQTLGAIAVLVSLVIFAAALIDATSGFPFDLPRTWYLHRPLWILFAVGLLIIGGWLQRTRRPVPAAWHPSLPGVRFARVVVYTREGCHLCDEAKDVLGKYVDYLPEIDETDVDTDPELQERFGTSIPVVEIDGQARFRGHVSEPLLRRLIEGTRPVG